MKISTPYIVESYYSIHDVPEIFDPLFEEAAKQSLFCSREWFTLLEQYVFCSDVLIFTITSSDLVPLLVLPCYESTNHGKQLHSLANYYSAFYMPLSNPKYSQQAELFDALFEKINGCQYQSITFQPLDNLSEEYGLLRKALKKNGYYTESFFCFGNWYETIQSSVFSAYYQQRPSKLKNTIRRKEKKLSNYRIKIESDYNEIRLLLPQYQKIYSSSWKVEEGYPLFVENMVLSLAKKNQIRLGVAYIDDVPAAAQLWFVSENEDSENIASIFKLAYDPRFKSTSIGSILTSAMFEYVIEKDKVKEIDYLSGDDAYKKDWMNQRRERWVIVAYNKKTVVGILNVLKRSFINVVKKTKLYQWYRS